MDITNHTVFSANKAIKLGIIVTNKENITRWLHMQKEKFTLLFQFLYALDEHSKEKRFYLLRATKNYFTRITKKWLNK